MPLTFGATFNDYPSTIGYNTTESPTSTGGNVVNDILDILDRGVDIADDIASIFGGGGGDDGDGGIRDTVQRESDTIVGTSISNWFSNNWLLIVGGAVLFLVAITLLTRR